MADHLQLKPLFSDGYYIWQYSAKLLRKKNNKLNQKNVDFCAVVGKIKQLFAGRPSLFGNFGFHPTHHQGVRPLQSKCIHVHIELQYFFCIFSG